jgi:carbonic anhydrase
VPRRHHDPDVRVSGHVYDVKTGLVTAVVDAKSKK